MLFIFIHPTMKHSKKLSISILFCLMATIAQAQTLTTKGNDGRLTQSIHDIYDADNNLSVRITYSYDTAGVVSQRQLTAYDTHGNITQIETYTADEILLYRENNRYDKHGNMVRRERHYYEENTDDKSVETRKYKYNKDNTCTITYYIDGKEYYKETK